MQTGSLQERPPAPPSRRENERRRHAATPLGGAFGLLPDPALALDGESGQLLDWNDALTHLLGHEESHFAGLQHAVELLLPEDRESLLAALSRLNGQDAVQHCHVELRLQHADGRGIPCECSLAPFPAQDGHATKGGALLLCRDITQRQQEREQLLAYARELKEAARRSQRASVQKSSFMAAMSHEIRTPLNVILGMSEVLATTSLNERQSGYLRLLETSGRSLLHLLGDILDYSRADAGQLKAENASVDVPALLGLLVQQFEHRAREKGLTLSADISPQLPQRLQGDAPRLEQVLRNLLDNAIKYTEHGTVSLQAGLAAPHKKGRKALLRFAVCDSGPGIDPGLQEEIFQPFVQVRPDCSREAPGGAGLGLAICKKIVEELLHGKLALQSTPGEGSCFSVEVSMPMAETQQPPAPVKELRPSPRAPRLPPLSLLCAEDAAENRELLRAFFEDSDHSLDFAYDGGEALRMISQRHAEGRPYDVVLMDVQMPVMDGLEATRRLREAEDGHRHMPVVALTAYALKGDAERCTAAGCDHYLAKPFSREQLFETLQRAQRGTAPERGKTSVQQPPQTATTDFTPASILAGRRFEVRPLPQLQAKALWYQERLQQHVQTMERALSHKDFETLALTAHKIKGSAHGFGFEMASRICAALEGQARGGDPRGCDTWLGALRHYADNLDIPDLSSAGKPAP